MPPAFPGHDSDVERYAFDVVIEVTAAVFRAGLEDDRLALEEVDDLRRRTTIGDDVDLMLERINDRLQVRCALSGSRIDDKAVIVERDGSRSLRQDRRIETRAKSTGDCGEQKLTSPNHLTIRRGNTAYSPFGTSAANAAVWVQKMWPIPQ